jgi:hypothetical protein
MKNFISITLFCCFVVSCQKNTKTDFYLTDNDSIFVDLSRTDFLNYSEIADSINYLSLETTEDCLLGIITGSQYVNGIWYISDRTFSIYLFDCNGKYINKLNSIGRGPGEYTFIQSFAVDSKNHIHILDLNIKKILEYNSDMEYISETRIDDYPRDFYVLPDRYILYMPDKNLMCRRGLYSLHRTTGEYRELINMEGRPDIAHTNRYIVFCEDNKYLVLDYSTNSVYFMLNDSIQQCTTFYGNDIGEPLNEKTYHLSGCEDYGNLLKISFGKLNQTGLMCFYNKKQGTMKIYSNGKNDIDGNETALMETDFVFNSIIHSFCQSTVNDEVFDENNPVLQRIYLKHRQ